MNDRLVGEIVGELIASSSAHHWRAAEALSTLRREEPECYLAIAGSAGFRPGRADEMIEVYCRFRELRNRLINLSFEHFVSVLSFTASHAHECLRWADEMKATVAEMRAWSRAQLGQPLETA